MRISDAKEKKKIIIIALALAAIYAGSLIRFRSPRCDRALYFARVTTVRYRYYYLPEVALSYAHNAYARVRTIHELTSFCVQRNYSVREIGHLQHGRCARVRGDSASRSSRLIFGEDFTGRARKSGRSWQRETAFTDAKTTGGCVCARETIGPICI